MWDLPGPGLKPVSPALAPPGKSGCFVFVFVFVFHSKLPHPHISFIYLFIKYLFIYLAVPGLSCGMQCGLFVAARGIFVAACGILSCSIQDLVP